MTGGREAGDALLKVFGKVLKRAASSYGFVGYNGSDQFTVCLKSVRSACRGL